jgi:hypothetical protein
MVQRIVARAFRELGADDESILETIFVDRGRCVARTYRTGDWTATWIIDEGAIEFHDAQKHLLRTITLADEEQQRAA